MEHTFSTETVKLGKKGQITIPKRIRCEDNLQEDDQFLIIHTPSGELVLRKKNMRAPEDTMLEAIRKSPKFDWRKAWKEVREERRQESA